MNTNHRSILATVCLLYLLLAGCSSSDSGSADACNGAVTELEGSWQYCNTSNGKFADYSFQNSCATVHIIEYLNSDCTGAVILPQRNWIFSQLAERSTIFL